MIRCLPDFLLCCVCAAWQQKLRKLTGCENFSWFTANAGVGINERQWYEMFIIACLHCYVTCEYFGEGIICEEQKLMDSSHECRLWLLFIYRPQIPRTTLFVDINSKEIFKYLYAKRSILDRSVEGWMLWIVIESNKYPRGNIVSWSTW